MDINSIKSILFKSKVIFSIKPQNKAEKQLVTMNESYNFNSDVTSVTLQNGAVASDHIQNKPMEMRISGIVSDTEINIKYTNPTHDSKDFFKYLLDLREQRLPLTIISGLDTFENMVITSISVTRDKDKSKALFVDIGFRQVNIVTIETITIDQTQVNKDLISSTSKPTNKGTVQPIPLTEAQKGAITKSVQWLKGLARG